MTEEAFSRSWPTPRETSPHDLMQERYRDDPWALLVGCILFNMVHGKKARPILEEFLRTWPSPESLWLSDGHIDGILDEMRRMFRPLGLHGRRADRIWKMTFDFLVLRPDVNMNVDVSDLHGVGEYGADSFNMFCRGYLVLDARDKELRKYLDWALPGAGHDEVPGRGLPADLPAADPQGGGDAQAKVPGPSDSRG